MNRTRSRHAPLRDSLVQGAALLSLLAMGAISLVGPSGILAWGENQRLLEERQSQLAELKVERERLQNRVRLLDPGAVDADLTGELLRSQLNVAHPDEMVILLD